MEWERAGVSIKQKINKEISINYYSLYANLLWFYYIVGSGKFLSVIKLVASTSSFVEPHSLPCSKSKKLCRR